MCYVHVEKKYFCMVCTKEEIANIFHLKKKKKKKKKRKERKKSRYYSVYDVFIDTM